MNLYGSTDSIDEAYCVRQDCDRPSVGTVEHWSMEPARACAEHGFAFLRDYPVDGLTFVTDAA